MEDIHSPLESSCAPGIPFCRYGAAALLRGCWRVSTSILVRIPQEATSLRQMFYNNNTHFQHALFIHLTTTPLSSMSSL